MSSQADRLDELYRLHRHALLAFASKRCGSRFDAEDVVSQAFVVACRRIDDIPADAARRWLFGVVANVIANERRSARRRVRLIDRLDATSHARRAVGEDPMSVVDVRLAMQELDAPNRALLEARLIGATAGEVAGRLGLSPNAVTIRLLRAREALRRGLDR